MTLLGKLICAARKLLRVKKVHDMRRVTLRESVFDMCQKVGESRIAVNRCTRCGHTVQVKPRKPRKQETEK